MRCVHWRIPPSIVRLHQYKHLQSTRNDLIVCQHFLLLFEVILSWEHVDLTTGKWVSFWVKRKTISKLCSSISLLRSGCYGQQFFQLRDSSSVFRPLGFALRSFASVSLFLLLQLPDPGSMLVIETPNKQNLYKHVIQNTCHLNQKQMVWASNKHFRRCCTHIQWMD